MTIDIDLLPCAADRLGESPVWDVVEGCLFWVDSLAQAIRRFDPSTGQEMTWSMPAQVGSIGLSRAKGHLIASLKDGFHDVDLASGAVTSIALAHPHHPAARLNDGKVDRQGRFVCGSLAPHDHPNEGNLLRLGRDGRVSCLETGIQISNTLSFSLDGRTMYFADSMRRVIWAYDYDEGDGAVGARRVLLDTAPLRSGTDGACIDADGCLWVALVEVGRVARITPGGMVDRVIDLPADYPSCPAFGGDGLSTLFVTSIRDSGGRLTSTRAGAGRVMAIAGLGVSGVPEPRYRAD